MPMLVLGVSALLVLADQLIKLWMLANLAGNPPILLIPHLLQLTYVENRGMAFGMLQGRVGLLSIVTTLVLVAGVVVVVKGMLKHPLALWSVGLIIAGGAGNLIDRVFRSFVVDYLDISPLFSFPVFNLADCCVVIGTILLLLYVLFFEEKSKKRAAERAAELAALAEKPTAETDGQDG